MLQMPLQEPVYKRERANSMYVPATYYFGRFISHTILQQGYPIAMVLIVVFGLDIDTDADNIIRLFLGGLMLSLTMTA